VLTDEEEQEHDDHDDRQSATLDVHGHPFGETKSRDDEHAEGTCVLARRGGQECALLRLFVDGTGLPVGVGDLAVQGVPAAAH